MHTLASYVTAKRPGLSTALPGLIHILRLFGRSWFCFNFIFKTESHYVAQAGLKLTAIFLPSKC